MPNEEYWRWTASEAVASLKKGDIKPVELIEAARSRIEAIDPIVNALPIRCFERATKQAGTADPNSLLAGLPIAVKDYNDIGGVRTTYGSPIYADYVPKRPTRPCPASKRTVRFQSRDRMCRNGRADIRSTR